MINRALLTLLLIFIWACGGALPRQETPLIADAPWREGDIAALKRALAQPEEGDIAAPAQPQASPAPAQAPAACAEACAFGHNVCALSERICVLADRHAMDLELRALCLDGGARCARAKARLSQGCICAPLPPKPH
ncbi:hypothetical protein KKB55_11320 [Myxococcota bacterium]|nr:hypothetical protein [Myxococcota bacterium]MBU1898328.1 hypothetical protein [Myxococcota bacterium]